MKAPILNHAGGQDESFVERYERIAMNPVQLAMEIFMAIFNICLDSKVLGYSLAFAVFITIFVLITGDHYFDYLYVNGHLPRANDWVSYCLGYVISKL